MDDPANTPPQPPADDHPDVVNAQTLTPTDPFTPQVTLAMDHVPPINVEVGTGAHHQPARPAPLPMEMGGLRVIIIGWCFWLLGSWAVAVFTDTAVPRARWMLLAGTLGMMLAWPAVRLSQSPNPDEPGRGALQVLLDWLSMIAIFQAVLWSLHLIAAWPLQRGLWLDAAIISWTLLSALIVGWARLFPFGIVRLLGMALCIALVVAEPLVLWLAGTYPGNADWTLRLSPLQVIWELSQPPAQEVLHIWQPRIIFVGLTAIAGWTALIGWRLIEAALGRGRRPEPDLIDLAAEQRSALDSDTIEGRSYPSA